MAYPPPSPDKRQDRGGTMAGGFLIPSQIQRGSERVTHVGVFPALVFSRWDLEGQGRINSVMGNTGKPASPDDEGVPALSIVPSHLHNQSPDFHFPSGSTHMSVYL